MIIHTTIDSRIQNFVEDSFNETILNTKKGLQNQFNRSILNTEDAYNDRLKDICSYIENDRIGVFNDSIYINLNREIRLLSSSTEDTNISNKIS